MNSAWLVTSITFVLIGTSAFATGGSTNRPKRLFFCKLFTNEVGSVEEENNETEPSATEENG